MRRVVRNMGMFGSLKELMTNVREMGIVGTLRRRFGRRGPEFQILTAGGGQETAPAPQPGQEAGVEKTKKKKIRGI